ncbi:MAG: NUDIX domain-containing protein [Geminicoccaceae bacterium]
MTLPRVGCGAAIVRNARILLVRRKRMPEAGHWGLPGGKVDPFETVPAAVVREVREELGIEIELRSLLCVVDQIDRTRMEHWIAPVYLVEQFAGDPVIREPQALAGCAWFPFDSLPEMLTVATRQAMEALLR